VEYTTNFGMGWPIGEGRPLHSFGSDETYYDLDIPLPAHAQFLGCQPGVERKAVLKLNGFSLKVGLLMRIF